MIEKHGNILKNLELGGGTSCVLIYFHMKKAMFT